MAETTASNAAASAPSWAADLAWQPSGSKFPAVDGHDSDAFHGACGSSADASHTSSQLHCGSHLQHETSPHRPSGGIVGSRKRKAYRPRNSGLDEEPIVEDCAPPPAHPYVPKAQNTVVKPSHASHKRAGSHTDSDDQHVPTRTSKRQRSASAAATSLAATRPRRAAKPRAHFDPDAFDLSSGDADGGDVCAAAATSASDDEVHFSHLAQHRHSSKGAAPHACASAVAALADHAPASAAVDEQRMFQEFRKRTCTAYTGVVVHCQNMKLEARVNMVSYLPDRERKIGGGQLYIAYMTNPHQAAIVHDITASIMTADGIPIYHNQNRRPSVNREVALERLNYLDTLEINTRRSGMRAGEELAGAHFMLSAAALRHELHAWVPHDSRWLTFRSWLEDVLFETKLASLCLMPKIIDEDYLGAESMAFVLKHAPECRRGGSDSAVIFTHTYDSLVMERVHDTSGALCGYKLLRKCYRRRKPELRSHALKWVDDKSAGSEIEEPATTEDQRRVDIAWRILQTWLRHHSASEVPPEPEHSALDANYYATWSQFARWVNELLAAAPHRLQEMRAAVAAGGACSAGGERGGSRRRVASSGIADVGALSQKAERLQAVYDKFRAVVAPGDSVSLTWHTALPAHRAAFENFFVGWKPLPPSMAGALGKHGSCGRRSNCGGGGGGSAALEATAPVATRRSTRTGARRSLAAALSEGETGEDDDGMGSPVKAADAPPHVEAAGGPVTTNAVQAAAPAAQPLQALHAQAQLPHVAAGTNMPFIDPSFSLWAMSRGLGAAVPPPSALPNAEQLQHAAAALGLQPQLQAQLLAQMAASTQLHNPGMHLSRADQSFARAALPQMQSQAMAQPMPAQPAAPQAPAQLPAGQISSETLLQYLQVPSLAAGLLAMQQAGSVKAGFEHFNARQGSNDSARSSGDCLRSPLPPTLPLQTNSTGGSAPTFPQLLADPAFALPGSAAQPPAGSAWSLFQK